MKKTEEKSTITPMEVTEPTQEQMIRGNQIYLAPQPAVTAPSGGVTQDTESRTAINTIIAQLVALGLFKKT